VPFLKTIVSFNLTKVSILVMVTVVVEPGEILSPFDFNNKNSNSINTTMAIFLYMVKFYTKYKVFNLILNGT
jgi:hypothetical protein